MGALLALWSRFVVVGQCASCCSSVGDVSLLCCVLNRTDVRVLSPGQTNVVYLTTLVVLCEWWDDYRMSCKGWSKKRPGLFTVLSRHSFGGSNTADE